MTTKSKFVAIVLPLAVLVSFAGCDASSSIAPVPSVIDGFWGRVDAVPGSGESWVLSETDKNIAVSGNWTGEACCAGSLTGNGVARGDSIHLDLQYFDGQTTTGTPRFTTHVDAALPSRFDIVGTVTGSVVSGTIHLKRVTLAVDRTGG